MSSLGFSHHYAEKLLEELAPFCSEFTLECQNWGDETVAPTDGTLPFAIKSRYVDPNFFKLFDFQILAGSSISEEDFQSATQSCVISDKLAIRLFGSVDKAVGESVKINSADYAIQGVFREPSFLQQNTYAQVMLPYTLLQRYYAGTHTSVGNFAVLARVKSDEAADSLMTVFNEAMRKFETELTQKSSRPEEQIEISVSKVGSLPEIAFGMEDGFSWSKLLAKYGFIILILLIVPAVNLGGLIAGNMETRLPEMGIRKSFGANRSRLLRSVLSENLVLTTVGGIIGLIVSWLLVWKWRNWMFFMDDSIMYDAPASVSLNITPEMIFAPLVFIVAFLLCCLVNVMAAMIPAWWSLRKPIVESLSENK